jgi:NTP pyrophosphatase (non-canonical NTP hydrolase)
MDVREVRSLPGLIREIRELNVAKGWRDHFDAPAPRTGPWFAAYCALASSEVSEALDAYRDKNWSSTREDGKPLGVGPELADALIRILDMADIWEVDLGYELNRVLDFGWTRPYQHGGRVL